MTFKQSLEEKRKRFIWASKEHPTQKESQLREGRLLSLLSDNKVSTAGVGRAGGKQYRGVEEEHEARLFRALRTTLRTLVLTVSKTGSYWTEKWPGRVPIQKVGVWKLCVTRKRSKTLSRMSWYHLCAILWALCSFGFYCWH